MQEKPTKVGFIGLGLMGQGFTRRLVASGYRVTGFDIAEDKVKQATEHGVVAAQSARDVAEDNEIILVCVTSTQAVEEVVFGPEGILENASPGGVLVDHSTTTLAATRDMAARLHQASGMGWVDAPVSGGPDGAATGSLAIMAGGAEEDLAKVTGLMADLSTTFTPFGPVGAGQVAKMVNQILVLNNYAVLAEALALAESGGIDAAKIPEALAPGHAGSNLLNLVFPRMIARDYAPKGYARQVLKDLDMLHDLAKELRSPTPMSSQTASLFRILNSKGYEELDGIAVHKIFDQKDSV
jgi:3-hydroxyisobutyrate dehydrogenase-like beta-hydroxyacid dehydrogenase